MDLPSTGAVAPDGVNKPPSGTYGEKAAAAGLAKQLPFGGGGQNTAPPAPPPVSAQPMAPDQGPMGRPPGQAVPGLSSVLTGPTTQPQVPVSTPLAQPPVNPMSQAQDPQHARIILLDQLSQSPQVSEETRTWAKHVLELLVGN